MIKLDSHLQSGFSREMSFYLMGHYRFVFMNKFRLKYSSFQSAKSLKKEAEIIDFLAILSGRRLTKFNYKGRAKQCIRY